MAIIAFDCDGTLWGMNDKPRWTIIDCLRNFYRMGGNRIVVWSGGGKDYAKQIVRLLHLEDFVDECASKTEAPVIHADICFDDEIVTLARVNIKV